MERENLSLRCKGRRPSGSNRKDQSTEAGHRGGAARRGSVSTCASKYSLCSRTCGDVSSCGLQDGQHGRGPPEVEQSLAVGGNMLVVAGAEAEKVAQFIVGYSGVRLIRRTEPTAPVSRSRFRLHARRYRQNRAADRGH